MARLAWPQPLSPGLRCPETCDVIITDQAPAAAAACLGWPEMASSGAPANVFLHTRGDDAGDPEQAG